MGPSQTRTTQLQRLLDVAAAGDEKAYDELIAAASKRLVGLTRKMLRNYPHLRRWEETDDVFQNAAIRLCRSLRKLKPESVRGFFGLVAVEIRRTLIDLLRHHFGPEGAAAKHESDVQASFNENLLLRSAPGPQDDAESLELWQRFHEAMEALPTEEREVMHLVWYTGITQAEVATALGVSVPTVKRRWYRARIRLLDAMKGKMLPVEESD
jgi:RNA polymerase sigma-70 factor (ECF subfamily)